MVDKADEEYQTLRGEVLKMSGEMRVFERQGSYGTCY